MLEDEKFEQQADFEKENMDIPSNTNYVRHETKETDKFTQMMFGTGRMERFTSKNPQSPQMPEDQQLRMMEIMEQLDNIYTSIQDLKPLFNEFSPVLNFLKDKIKSFKS